MCFNYYKLREDCVKLFGFSNTLINVWNKYLNRCVCEVLRICTLSLFVFPDSSEFLRVFLSLRKYPGLFQVLQISFSRFQSRLSVCCVCVPVGVAVVSFKKIVHIHRKQYKIRKYDSSLNFWADFNLPWYFQYSQLKRRILRYFKISNNIRLRVKFPNFVQTKHNKSCNCTLNVPAYYISENLLNPH